jgi:hypothetical protein
MLSGNRTPQSMYLLMFNFDYNSVVFLVKTLNKLYAFSLILPKINEDIIKINIGKKDLLTLTLKI